MLYPYQPIASSSSLILFFTSHLCSRVIVLCTVSSPPLVLPPIPSVTDDPLFNQNPGYMKEAFHITIETLHATGKGELQNVSAAAVVNIICLNTINAFCNLQLLLLTVFAMNVVPACAALLMSLMHFVPCYGRYAHETNLPTPVEFIGPSCWFVYNCMYCHLVK